MNKLNKIQSEAVEYMNGPSLIVAGAGSGKTLVLTYKIAYMIAHGIDPSRIMALTFTNKAADEMRKRLGAIIGDMYAKEVNMGTFHSVFAKFLQYDAYCIGWNSRFSILDETDSKNLIADIINQLSLDCDNYKPAKVKARISMAKNNLISPEDYDRNKSLREQDEKDKMKYLSHIYMQYQNRLRETNSMDFDDLLMNFYRLLKENPSARERYENSFDWIFVDEFQDTNYSQMQILALLTKSKQNVVVVGDDAQSIYSFRGANIDNILNFNKVYPTAKVFKLEQNYRSTRTIVAGANSLIHQNKGQIDKNVFSDGEMGDKIHYVPFYTDRNEGEYVAQSIREVKRVEECNWSDITVLYRSNAIARLIEENLLQYKVPYTIHGGISFFQRTVVKNILAYLRLIANRFDDEAFKRIINWPKRGIGAKTQDRMQEIATKYHCSMMEVAENAEYYGLIASAKTVRIIDDFACKIKEIELFAANNDVSTVTDHIFRTFQLDEEVFNTTDIQGNSNQVVNELLDSIDSFVRARKDEGRENQTQVYNYIQDVALLANEVEQEKTDSVNLMTIHASKGLEFNTIYIVGCEEGLFPSKKSAQSSYELEEERRLMYVAITRAEKHCFITNAKKRWIYGEEQKNEPSRFIQDISDEFIEEVDAYAVDDEDENDDSPQGYFD